MTDSNTISNTRVSFVSQSNSNEIASVYTNKSKCVYCAKKKQCHSYECGCRYDESERRERVWLKTQTSVEEEKRRKIQTNETHRHPSKHELSNDISH